MHTSPRDFSCSSIAAASLAASSQPRPRSQQTALAYRTGVFWGSPRSQTISSRNSRSCSCTSACNQHGQSERDVLQHNPVPCNGECCLLDHAGLYQWMCYNAKQIEGKAAPVSAHALLTDYTGSLGTDAGHPGSAASQACTSDRQYMMLDMPCVAAAASGYNVAVCSQVARDLTLASKSHFSAPLPSTPISPHRRCAATSGTYLSSAAHSNRDQQVWTSSSTRARTTWAERHGWLGALLPGSIAPPPVLAPHRHGRC